MIPQAAGLVAECWTRDSRRHLAGRLHHGRSADAPGTGNHRAAAIIRRWLRAGALAVLAPRPAAGPALSFLQLLPRAPNAALTGSHLLGILDPADELIAGQRRDVLPGIKRRGIGDQRHTKIGGQFVHNPAGNSLTAHRPMVLSAAARSTGEGLTTRRAWLGAARQLRVAKPFPASRRHGHYANGP